MCFVDTIDQNLKRKEKKMSLKYFPMLVHLILIASWLVSREESFKLANEVEDPQVMHRLQKFIAATYFRHIESNIWLNNNNTDVVAVAQSSNRLSRANKELAVAKFWRQTGGNYCLFCDLIAVIFSYSKDISWMKDDKPNLFKRCQLFTALRVSFLSPVLHCFSSVVFLCTRTRLE